MPEPQAVAPATTSAEAPVPQSAVLTEAAPSQETALTREEVAALLATAKTEVTAELRRELENAYKAARRGEAKGDQAQKAIAKVEARLETVATRGMDETEARLWRAQRAEERAAEASSTVSNAQEYERVAAEFQQRSASYLASEGIKSDDPVLTAAFSKFTSESKSYADWDTGLVRAVAEVHKARAKALADEQKGLSDKVREEERAKLRNEQRTSEGAVDKGAPASNGQKKAVWDMSEEEFKTYDAQRDQERKLRTRRR